MSTRSQIGFYDDKNTKPMTGDILIYRHSDGDPESVLKDLVPFVNHFKKFRGLDDTTYATARCVQHLTNLYDKMIREINIRHNRQFYEESLMIGYGVTAVIVCDIEYFYHVSPTEIKVYDTCTQKKWKLIKTVELEKIAMEMEVRL